MVAIDVAGSETDGHDMALVWAALMGRHDMTHLDGLAGLAHLGARYHRYHALQGGTEQHKPLASKEYDAKGGMPARHARTRHSLHMHIHDQPARTPM
jgi:hypothetical protein